MVSLNLDEAKSKVRKILIPRFLYPGDAIVLKHGKFGGFYKVVELEGRKYKSTSTLFEVINTTGELVYKGSTYTNSVFYLKNHDIYISMLRGHSYRDYERVNK